MKIKIEGDLPDLNSYINTERRNRFMAAKVKKMATDLVMLQSLKYKGKLTEFPVDLVFEWHCSSKRGHHLDHDNKSFAKKFILDGFVKAGVLPDDNPKYVGDFTDVFVDDTTNHVIVTLV
jgi:hypothetical protein